MVYITDVQIILLPNKIKDNMTKINEILTSIILYSIISYILGLNHLEMGLLFAVLGSQANILLPQNYKHTLFLVMPLSIVTLLYPTIFFPVTIGYISSIFISLLSKNGCKLIYPLKIQHSQDQKTTWKTIQKGLRGNNISCNISDYNTNILIQWNRNNGTIKSKQRHNIVLQQPGKSNVQ